MSDRAVPGKRIRRLSADTWNDMEAAARAFRGSRLENDDEGGGFDYPEPGFIKVRNDTGTALPRFSIVAIGDPWTTPSAGGATLDVFKTRRTCAATIPAEINRGKFAILVDGCAPSGVVDAVASGIVQCQVVVNSGEETFEWADVEVGSTAALHVATSGAARILWRESGTGTKWAQVRLSNRHVASQDGFYIRNEYSTLTAGRGLELGQLYSAGVVKANIRTDCDRAYAILAEDIAFNTIGQAKVSGFATARVDVIDVDHTHCFLRAGEVVFETGFGGPLELCQTPTTTGAQDLLVRWQPLYRRRVFTNVTISANSSGDCNFYVGPGLGTILGSDDVYFSWMKGGVASIASGVEGWATWDDGVCIWVLDSAECD